MASAPSTISRLIVGARVDVDPSFVTPSTFQNYDKYQLHIKITRPENQGLHDETDLGNEYDDYFFTQWARGRKLVRELKDSASDQVINETTFSGTDTVDGGVVNKAFEAFEDGLTNSSVLPLIETEKETPLEKQRTRDQERPVPVKPRTFDRRTAFLIHSFGECHKVWNPLTSVFTSRGFSVVAPDLIGHGYSSCPNDRKHYTFDVILENLLDIFDKQLKRFGNRAVVCGSGYGAAFATAIARKRAPAVELLILIDCGGPIPLAPLNYRWSKYPSLIYKILQPFVKQGIIKRNRLFNPRGKYLCHSASDSSLPRYVAANYNKGQYWPAGDIGFHRRVTQPCLLIYSPGPNASLIEMLEMERTLPRGYLEIVPGREESRQRKVIADFLDSFLMD